MELDMLTQCYCSDSLAKSANLLAPSLTCQRINESEDSINQFNNFKKIMECQERASRRRLKTTWSPSQILTELRRIHFNFMMK
ncbi:unnamed protein product [Caenorhabditis angaria]|uniref:Uncharacterized protein n=1 Tax=Caenorhabditis angaria TaxID=860376 RepID=A0A9P1IXH8_9PELO|nr:unnamed protein product [Caenorhabditis angaria]